MKYRITNQPTPEREKPPLLEFKNYGDLQTWDEIPRDIKILPSDK